MIRKLALGTAQFGLNYGVSNTTGKTAINEVYNILIFCREKGITFIDTASAYGDSESVLGFAGVSDFQIVSKFINNKNENDFRDQLYNSLKKLKVDQLYAYLAHCTESTLQNKWEQKCIHEARSDGLIQKAGVSLNTISDLKILLDSGFLPDIIQVPYNYIDRRFESIMMELHGNGVEIHARSCFLQGLLLMPPDKTNDFFKPLKPFLKTLHDENDNVRGSLLKFVIEKSFIDKVVIGVESLNQLSQNLNSLADANELNIEAPNVDENILAPSKWNLR